MFDLQGKKAIITGGASGIGAAAVRLFQQSGAHVVIADVQVEMGEELAAELGDRVLFERLDVADPMDWERTIDTVEAAIGPIDILVNNAAIGSFLKPVSELSFSEYRHVCSINQDSVFLGTKYIVPSMVRAGGGSIVNTSSAYGLIGVADNMDYCAAKWAVTGMTKAAAVELAPFKIRVNSVHPGLVLTPMVAETLVTLGPIADEFISRMPLNRPAQPPEIARVIAFLASDAASFVTGAAVAADGGLTAQ